jgi:hypothetical protein
MESHLRRTIVRSSLLLLVAVTASAQIHRGTIQGVVRDQTGGNIPSAKVQVIRLDTNSALELETNGELPVHGPQSPRRELSPGVPEGRICHHHSRVGRVRPRMDVRVDATLQPGAVTESITVNEQAPLLDTNSMNNAAWFQQDMIQELPLIVVGSKRCHWIFEQSSGHNERQHVHAARVRIATRRHRSIPGRGAGE